ncbi:expressed unknown protein [Seminavis robusta]|uniref:SET domain-containing protein n=1 Tax=Seminavis robusta TaxID=568900 RepID=A0A9N8H9U1_9STRA|nr:expressed unknown protein [Seminavis robusta]|eukprot:Sro268_g103630.1 n/a (726) ;mRNA; f:17725-19902
MTQPISATNENNKETRTMTLYHMPVSLAFLLVSAAVGMGVSFLVGSTARTYLLHTHQQQQLLAIPPRQTQEEAPNFVRSLPPPVLGTSPVLPASTRYSSKRFKTEGTASESFLVRSTSSSADVTSRATKRDKQDETKRQRFSVDLAGRALNQLQDRLSTESSVVQLLKEIMKTSHSTILSYHCDQVSPRHMTCVGIATQGHIIIHTAPQQVSIDANGVSLDHASVETILGQPMIPTSELVVKKQTTADAKTERKELRVASALVHPAMLASSSKETETAVLVGGSVASLKQLLQHSTLKHLILLEMDQSWNVEGKDYPRVEIRNEKAADWFARAENRTVDMIFVETTPGTVEIAADMERVLKKDDSALVLKMSIQTAQNRAVKSQWLEALAAKDRFGFIKEYDEGEANFLMAFSDDHEMLGRWFASEAMVRLSIREKLLPPFDYVDATDIMSYHNPSRLAADAFCDNNPEDDACEGLLDPERALVPISSFEVKLSTVENAGRGIFVKHDIQEGSYVFIDTCVQNVYITDATIRVVDEFVDHAENMTIPLKTWNILMGYADGYGFTAEDFGYRAYDVDPGIASFVNHGCNGTANVGDAEYQYLTELSYTGFNITADQERYKIYNPAMDRSRRTVSCAGSLAMRDMEQGEEVFNNYMTFEAWDDVDEYAESLRAECAGQAIGQISEYEMSAKQPRQLLPVHASEERLQLLDSNLTESCRLCGVMQDIS